MTAFSIHLMRHGAPEIAGRLLGHLDAPPEPNAMSICCERAAGLDFGKVITSDLSRASTPGALIAGERGATHYRDRRWRELDFGSWEGVDPATLPADDLSKFWEDPDSSPPPGGERWSHLRGRVGDALRELVEPTLILSHAGAMRAALAVLCGFDQRQVWAFDLPYGACISLRIWPGQAPTAQITGLVT